MILRRKKEMQLDEVEFEAYPDPEDGSPHVIMRLRGEGRTLSVVMDTAGILEISKGMYKAVSSLDDGEYVPKEEFTDMMYR